jgi:hypothetical protein
VRVSPVMYFTPLRKTGRSSQRFSDRAMYYPAKRSDEERHVVGQLLRSRSVLDPTRPTSLRDRLTVGIEQTLENRQPDIGSVTQIFDRNEFVV